MCLYRISRFVAAIVPHCALCIGLKTDTAEIVSISAKRSYSEKTIFFLQRYPPVISRVRPIDPFGFVRSCRRFKMRKKVFFFPTNFDIILAYPSLRTIDNPRVRAPRQRTPTAVYDKTQRKRRYICPKIELPDVVTYGPLPECASFERGEFHETTRNACRYYITSPRTWWWGGDSTVFIASAVGECSSPEAFKINCRPSGMENPT